MTSCGGAAGANDNESGVEEAMAPGGAFAGVGVTENGVRDMDGELADASAGAGTA